MEFVVDVVWDIGCEFGIIGSCFGNEMIEIIIYCSDVYDGLLCKLDVFFGDSFEVDLMCCDFMINVMVLWLFDLIYFELCLIDLMGGIDDLFVFILCILSVFEIFFGDDLFWMLCVVCFVL